MVVVVEDSADGERPSDSSGSGAVESIGGRVVREGGGDVVSAVVSETHAAPTSASASTKVMRRMGCESVGRTDRNPVVLTG